MKVKLSGGKYPSGNEEDIQSYPEQNAVGIPRELKYKLIYIFII